MRREEDRKCEDEKKRRREERLSNKKKLEEKWAMMKWLVHYIDENKEQWRVDKEIRQNEKSGDIIDSVDMNQTPPQTIELPEKHIYGKCGETRQRETIREESRKRQKQNEKNQTQTLPKS